MDFEIGSILTGKVTGITKFGAFVNLAPGKSGLVHISEIANTYVNDVHDFLTEGQEVKVKLISVDDAGRINLSIKQALPAAPAAPRPQAPRPQQPPRDPGQRPQSSYRPASRPSGSFTPRRDYAQQANTPAPSFEDRLKRFMQDSDSKLADFEQYKEKRPSRRRSHDPRDYED
jgi:S1 RNA binding domain protein